MIKIIASIKRTIEKALFTEIRYNPVIDEEDIPEAVPLLYGILSNPTHPATSFDEVGDNPEMEPLLWRTRNPLHTAISFEEEDSSDLNEDMEDELEESLFDEDENRSSPSSLTQDEIDEEAELYLDLLNYLHDAGLHPDEVSQFWESKATRSMKRLNDSFSLREQIAMIWLIYRCERSSPYKERRILDRIIFSRCKSWNSSWKYSFNNPPPLHVQKRMMVFKSCLEELGLYCREVDDVNYWEVPETQKIIPSIKTRHRDQMKRRNKARDLIIARIFL